MDKDKFSKICKSNVRTAKVHERRVAKLLSSWSGVPFRRRRVEGRDNAVRIVELVADVISCAGDFNFAVECKKGKGFSPDALMANPAGSKFTEWWHQACYDAQLVSKDFDRIVYPLMFFKPHPNLDWVAYSAHAVPSLSMRGVLAHLRFDHFSTMGPVDGDVSHTKKPKIVAIELDPVIICRWRDFEVCVDPKSAFCRYPTDEEIIRVSNQVEA